MGRRAAVLLGVPLVAGLVGMALPAQAQDTPLVIARAMDINSLDPARTWCDTCQIYVSNVYETLIGLGADNKTLMPRLATSWETSDDQSQFTFRLDPEALFSDGSPLEAKDVKWSWERLKNVKGGPSFMMDGVNSVEAPDAHTVVVTMAGPNSEFLGILTAPYMGVINSDVAIANGANANADADQTDTSEPWFMANSAGSGPYVLAGYKADDELRFAATCRRDPDAPGAGAIAHEGNLAAIWAPRRQPITGRIIRQARDSAIGDGQRVKLPISVP